MSKTAELPSIPEKHYFTIGEVAILCKVKPHVLRYWESEFSVLKPNKRRGSRRYYQLKDVLMIRQIRELLYEKGFTISGARRQLKQPISVEKKVAEPVVIDKTVDEKDIAAVLNKKLSSIQPLISELEQLLNFLREPTASN